MDQAAPTVQDVRVARAHTGALDIRSGWYRLQTRDVLSRRESASRPGRGIVEWKTSAVNQRGEPVLEFRRRNLSRRRDAGQEEDT